MSRAFNNYIKLRRKKDVTYCLFNCRFVLSLLLHGKCNQYSIPKREPLNFLGSSTYEFFQKKKTRNIEKKATKYR